jgi:hypothetical protein
MMGGRRTDAVFSFSKVERIAILGAVRSGCASPSSFNEKVLRFAATRYRNAQHPHRRPSAEAAIWRRRARIAAQFYREFHDAILVEEQEHDLAPSGGRQHLAVMLLKVRLYRVENTFLSWLFEKQKTVSVMEVVKRCEQLAEQGVREMARHHNHPRKLFFEEICQVWISAGGSLAASRHPDSRVASGPLVRYLRAVTGAVMGVAAPTPEAIYKLIRRMKKSYLDSGFIFDENSRALVDEKGDFIVTAP